MTTRFIVGLAVIVAALIPWTATATATGDPPASGEVDTVLAELDGSGEINVFGTVRCTTAGPLNLDVTLEQASTGGVGGGGSNNHICLAPGDLVKWVIDATGGPWMVDDPVTITALSVGGANDTDIEDHVLDWGLPESD